MSGVDNRIVTMKFDNRQFEQGARASMSTLAKLKQSMDFGKIVGGTVRGLGTISDALSKIGLKTPFAPLIAGANKGLGLVGGTLDRLGMKNPFSRSVDGAGELQRAAQAAGGPAGMGVLEGGVTAVSGKFIALSTIAITAISNITNKAINATTTWLKSFSVAPIMDGLREYETTLQSIQTVQANTDRPLPEIEKALKDLNAYSDTTIYNFGEMAKNVGTFTAAGINLKDSVASIKGIANVAALSGSNSQQAAGAMYQLSQAIAAGKVGAQDWNSVVNAGMAGKKLQTALARTAVVMGVLDKNAVTTNKSTGALQINAESFKNSIMAKPGQESWLSSGVLVNTLASLDGRFSVAYQKAQLTEKGVRKFTDAQIKSNMAEARANLEKKLGHKFSDQQYKDLLQMANASTKAAQDVKTLGQVFDIAKETIGSGWAASFKNVFGNLKQSKKLFTGMSEGLGDIIRQNALARNELLAKWSGAKMGGRATLIAALTTAWHSFYDVIKAIGKGFRDVFPRKTAADLQSMTMGFALLMQKLTPSEETLGKIRSIAGGVASVFHIVWQVIQGVATGFKALFDSVGGGNGDFLSFAATIGESIKRFDAFLEKSGIITAFFQGLGQILSVPLSLLKGLGAIIAGIFGGFDPGTADKVGESVGAIGDRLSGLQVIGARLRTFFEKVGEFFGNLGGHIADALMGVGDMVANAFSSENFGTTLDVINTTLLGGIVLLIRNFFAKGVSIDLTGGLFDGIKETLGSATGAFENMQNTLKADILLKIAGAIAVMAAALLVLSMIDPAALTKALGAMGAGFGILIAAMAVLMKTMGAAGLVQLYIITSAMTKMAASILLLSFALKTLAGIKFGDMLRGLAGLAAMMYILSKAMLPMAAGSKGMAKAATSLILVGIAVNILAVALKILATMSWEEMVKGLAGLAGIMFVLAAAFKVMPEMKAEALSLIALGIAINLLAIALKVMATMSYDEITRGLVTLAGALAIISAAINSMPKTMMLQAAALVLVAGSLVVLAGALKIMGSMGWEEIGKGMVVLAGAMIILSAGLTAIGFSGTVGAVGLLAAVAGLAALAPIMLAFGAMSWDSIINALTMLAGTFVILGAAGYALAPVTPVLIGVGAAMALMGIGIALAGAGALAAATAFGLVVAMGTAAAQLLGVYLSQIISVIPTAMAAFGKGVVLFAVAIGEGAPRIAQAFGRILNNLLNQAIKAIPKVGRLFTTLILTALRVIVTLAPRIFSAGLTLINGFLGAIARNVPRIADNVTKIITTFMAALGRNLPKIVDAGYKMIIKFMNGLSKAIRENSDEMGEAGADLGMAIIEGVVKGLGAAGGKIKDKLLDLAGDAWESTKDFFGVGSPSKLMRDTVGRHIPTGLARGIDDAAPEVARAMGEMGRTAVSKMEDTVARISDSLVVDPNFNPTVTPVLDLSALTQEANKMSSILATAPIMAGVSYQTASDISAMTQASAEAQDAAASSDAGGRGDTNLTLELHSPKPIDSVESYRAGKTLISLAKEALS